ncbi:MAG: DUF4837 family protein [Longimicrobiaceae bacterium]
MRGAHTLLPILCLLAACDKPMAWGDANSIIVGMDPAQWEETGGQVYDALEPRVFTVRDERMFDVTHASPSDPRWPRFREFKRVLLVGEPGDAWLAEALERVGGDTPTPAAVAEAEDVWARHQQVVIVLTRPGRGAGHALALLEEAGERFQRDFRRYVLERMYTSGADTERARQLRREVGFSLTVPELYDGERVAPNAYLFRNDHPDPSELIRSILVTWREPDGTPISTSEAVRWRELAAQEFYQPPQLSESGDIQPIRLRGEGWEATEIRGVWSSPPEAWPAAGPFTARVVSCHGDDRVYLLDSWLYAPGKAKYEYMIQLWTILDTFACGPGRG